PDPGEERADRCALDVNRYAALTKARLSDGTRGAARCRQEAPLKRSYSPRRWLMNGRCRIRPFSAVEFGRRRNRIECDEAEKIDQESADMRLPSNRLLDARHAHGENPEQNIDAEPDQHECEHGRIAEARRERCCGHPTRLGGISPQLERPATLERKPCRRGH